MKNTSKIRPLLPKGWLFQLVKSTGHCKQTVSNIVNKDLVCHPAWPKVLDLAEKHQNALKLNTSRTKSLVGSIPESEAKKAAKSQKLA